MRLRVTHPGDDRFLAFVGFDAAVGWWGEVRRDGRLLAEVGDAGVRQTTLADVLRLLTEHAFFDHDDVAEALRLLPHVEAEEIGNLSTRRAATVITALKAAAAD